MHDKKTPFVCSKVSLKVPLPIGVRALIVKNIAHVEKAPGKSIFILLHNSHVIHCASRNYTWKAQFLFVCNGGFDHYILNTGWPRFGSVRLRFGDGTVRAVPVFGPGGSLKEGVCVCFSTV